MNWRNFGERLKKARQKFSDPKFDLDPNSILTQNLTSTKNSTSTQNSILTQINVADKGFIIKNYVLWAFLVLKLIR